MEIKRVSKNDESVSIVTVDGAPVCTMDTYHSMLTLFSNKILLNAHYGDDYLVRDAPGGNVIDRWFVKKYGWERFWPPGATIKRVEYLMLKLRCRARRAQQRLAEISAEIVADVTLPRNERSEVLICGLNRYKNEIEYAIDSDGRGGYTISSASNATVRSAFGDRYVRVVDYAQGAWSEHYRFRNIFLDLIQAKLFVGEVVKTGIYQIRLCDRQYWFRIFYGRRNIEIESLDDYGTISPVEIEILT